MNIVSLLYAQFWYNSIHNYHIIKSIVDEFSAYIFWILMHFQVEPNPKDPDPPVKMWRIRIPDLNKYKEKRFHTRGT